MVSLPLPSKESYFKAFGPKDPIIRFLGDFGVQCVIVHGVRDSCSPKPYKIAGDHPVPYKPQPYSNPLNQTWRIVRMPQSKRYLEP